MKDETIIAYYNGIEVLVIPENSFLNKNGTITAALEKIDDCVPDGIPVPKHVPFDNLSFQDGQKCLTVKLMRNLFIKQKKERQSKNKTIKKPLTKIH